MKLAIVRQRYTPFGGAERFVQRALAGLRGQGVDVTVIARRWSGDAGQVLRCDPFYLGRTWRDAGFARGVQRIIAEGRFDLVQSHERIPGCHLYRAGDGVHATWLELRAKARGAPARLAAALSPWHRYTLAAEAAMFGHPALRGVICNSRMVRDDIARRFGLAGDKLHVIYNGVDLDHFHPGLREQHRRRVRTELGISEKDATILFVGSGFERKGLATLLRAMAAPSLRAAQLVVVGKDRAQKLHQDLAQTLGVAARVHFLGGREEVRPYYGAADVFCLPTLYDPMPNAALEAFACGLPVVATTDCGVAELIVPGVNGGVCPPHDPAALAACLAELCARRAEPALYEAARDAVAGLDLAAAAGRLAALYERLAAA